jgi:hypothetical protein
MPGELQPVEEQILFCRNPEQFGDGTALNILRTNRPKWWIVRTPSWLTVDQLNQIFEAGVNRWSKVANVYATRADSMELADWIIDAQSIDGPGKILADAELPGFSRQQKVRIDIAESALRDRMSDILGHEGGHLYGLHHFSSAPPPEWMEPTLGVVNTPQQAEASLMAQLYGLPQSTPPGSGPSIPPVVSTCRIEVVDGIAKASISVQQANKKAMLDGNKQMV